MSATNRRSFLARSAALAAVPAAAALAGGALPGRASAAALPGHPPVLPSSVEHDRRNVVLRPHPGAARSQLPRHGFWYGMPGAYSCHCARVIAAPVTAQSRVATAAGSVSRKTTE